MGYTTPLYIPSGIIVDRNIKLLANQSEMITPFVESSKREDESGNKILSYGLSSAGYDVRLGYEFKVIRAAPTTLKYKINQLDVLEGTAAEWFATTRPIDKGVVVKESDTGKYKEGNGINLYYNLPYLFESPTILSAKDPVSLDNNFKSFNVVPGQSFIIHPGDFVLGTTIESFNIPDDVLVTVHKKSTYARVGVDMMTTIIEPGQTGQITIEIASHVPVPVEIYPGEGIAQFIFEKLSTTPDVPYGKRNGKYMNQSGVTLPKV